MVSPAEPLFAWIEDRFGPSWAIDGSHLYDGMDSQSDRSLPVIYQPFDADQRGHWCDRGRILDYRVSVGSGRILDVGPGDGWPSLLLAPMVDEVVGVDVSETLREVARANARRLDLPNASFQRVESATRLPFPDSSFDGVTAASSLEQSEDPRAVLAELCRVIRPGGRLRMYYEALGRYRGGQEQQAWLMRRDDESSYLFVSDYDVDGERARHVRLHLKSMANAALDSAGIRPGSVRFGDVSIPLLEELSSTVRSARGSRLRHPSGATWARWLAEAGFGEVHPTRSGGEVAGHVFDATEPAERPRDLIGVDAVLYREVSRTVREPAALDTDPMITAVL